MTSRHPLTTLAVLSTVGALLAGCAGTPSARWRDATGERTAAPDAAVPVADWRPCPEVAEETLEEQPPDNVRFDCATIKVPKDWADPSRGEALDIALLRARSQRLRPGRHVGSLVINPGGPGGSGIDTAVYLSLTMPFEVLRRFDIVGFDPRGVGRSSPVECFSNPDTDAMIAADPDPVGQREFDKVVDLSESMIDDCRDKYGEDLEYFSTEQTARDIDAIRQAVGDKKLSYLGYSYGTLLGAVYAKLFPDRIRAMVLDGAVDPAKDEIEGSEGQAAGFERAFGNFAQWCAEKSRSQCPSGPDARDTVRRLLDEAREDPASGSDGRQATAGWVLSAVVYTMYVQEWWPRLADALGQLDRGDPDGIFQIVDTFNEREADGDYPNSFEILTLVNCVDEEKAPSVAEVRRLQKEWRRKYPLFGAPLALSILGCAVWPVAHDPYPYGRADGAPPILVIGTTGDPATPYEQAGALAKLLGTGILVTYRGEGHTAYPKSGCLNDVVDDYLIDLKTPRSGVTC
ncbi:MAG TPA: alpha/beta hydrolase [Micromonosporaceae bacterium]